jgi:hypothetical protein
VKASFRRVVTVNNSHDGLAVSGFGATGTLEATVSDSVAANNNIAGFEAPSRSGAATVSLMLVRSQAVNNGTGVLATSSAANSTVRLTLSVVTGNTIGLSTDNTAGAIVSYGDNSIDGNNGGGETPSATIVKK